MPAMVGDNEDTLMKRVAPFALPLAALRSLGMIKQVNRKCPNVVGSELHLESVFAKRTFRYIHHGSIVHNDINGEDIDPGEYLNGSLADGFLARKVELERTIVHAGKLCFESVDAFLNSGWVATCYDKKGWGLRSLVIMSVLMRFPDYIVVTHESLCC